MDESSLDSKGFYPLKDTLLYVLLAEAVDAQVLNSTAYLNGCTSIPNNLVWAGAWLRTVRCEVHSQILNPLQLPLFRSVGTDETTLIKQENLDNGACFGATVKQMRACVHCPGLSLQTFYRPERRDSPRFNCRSDLRLGRC